MLSQFVNCEHPCWPVRFELSSTDEDHNGFDGPRWQEVEKVTHGLRVSHVLKKWILERVLATKHHLRPFRMLGIGEDPTVVVLGLDDKDAKSRDQDVVYLRCPVLQF